MKTENPLDISAYSFNDLVEIFTSETKQETIQTAKDYAIGATIAAAFILASSIYFKTIGF